jgi:hypothetical protein
MVEAVRDVDASLASDANKQPGLRPSASDARARLQSAASDVLSSSCEMALALQASLLRPASLSADPGVPLHALSGAARAVALTWRSVADLGYSRVARSFDSLKLEVGRQLVSLYADAAAEAADMLGAGGGDGGGDAGLEEPEAMPHHPTSVWACSSSAARADGPPPPGDAAVLAHGWVPSLLASLLGAAGLAHKRLGDDLAVRERDLAAEIPLYPELSESEEDAIAAANDAALDCFFQLALASTRRTARLCSAPGALAIWALESLKEQSEAALRFGEALPLLCRCQPCSFAAPAAAAAAS